ncbi:hypothetical protein LCGC14_1609950 [marine sediment metagenome]|uniref:Uncharacterized protein n=1 Tax=marine sediment metagenome TaxID=412755 RepID=A0A0F9KPG4_9ZZZZ
MVIHMDNVELLEHFINSNSAPDELSTEWNHENKPFMLWRWENGTILILPYEFDDYILVWNRFQKYWNKNI